MNLSHIQLRAPEPQDIDLIYHWENDTSIWSVSNTLAPYSRYTIEQFVINSIDKDIYTTKQIRLMIDLVGDAESQTIGTVDLYDFDPFHKRVAIGILIDEKYRKQGFAKHALKMIIRYCFETLNLHQVYCSISENNYESMQLFVGLGFEKCAEKKEWRFINNRWLTEYMYQLLKSKYKNQ